jgi:hypothetical protein
MLEHLNRRPIPIDQSIVWKPLHDSHYIVASLQSGDGGRRKIFVRQQVLGRIQGAARAHGRRALGLLLGQLYRCPVSGADYLVVEAVDQQSAVSDENEIGGAIGDALAAREAGREQHGLESSDARLGVIGWYRGAAVLANKPSAATAAVHKSLFSQPWQLVLVVGEGSDGSSGAIFLHDMVNSRWFVAPFYELLSHVATATQPKPTLINWPEYLTTDEVTFSSTRRDTAPNESPAAGAPAAIAADAQVPSALHHEPRPAAPFIKPLAEAPIAPAKEAPTSAVSRAIADRKVSLPADPPNGDRVADRPAQRSVHDGLADVPTPRDRPIGRRSYNSDKLSIIDDSDQRTLPASQGPISDHDDTSGADHPGRFIEIARAEGFFIASRFDASSDPDQAETLWVLNEPYSGMLLALVATDSQVVDATLHYNLHTDDAGLERVLFPEHRDVESKTIYVRETCVESLRARCRRLRSTNSLLREWKVAPKIAFLTPGEWESVSGVDSGPAPSGDAITRLNNARIAELPAGVRTQFHLGTAGADGASEATA